MPAARCHRITSCDARALLAKDLINWRKLRSLRGWLVQRTMLLF